MLLFDFAGFFFITKIVEFFPINPKIYGSHGTMSSSPAVAVRG